MIELEKIVPMMPYGRDFLFADRILGADSEGILGTYTFRADAPYIRSHFPGHPVVPGVLITEAAAQIGLVAFAIFLTGKMPKRVAMTAVKMDFMIPVMPNQEITVQSKMIYFRFGKLKCAITVTCSGEVVAEGTLEGFAHE